MTDDGKLLYRIALTQIKGVGDIIARNLLNVVGDEEGIFRSSRKSLLSVKGISPRIVDAILDKQVLQKAEKELAFISKNKIKTYFITDDGYPYRLKECIDAPVLLYFKGNADINSKRVISIVGTRKSTDYGNGFCEHFLEEISQYYTDALIVSGLAYGIDIKAHRSALKNNLPTIGILAHGLDRIYPGTHRKTAVEMLENGGLLTEFPSGTEPDKFNFVRRNRIVAGLADAVIVVESDVKGGSLITAEIANSYDREVFALPGKITDNNSRGCNRLISNNKAVLFDSVDAFLQQMNWVNSNQNKKIEKQLFVDLTDSQRLIYDILFSAESMHVNNISVETGINISQLFSDLLEMEIRGIVRSLPGGVYKLIK